MLINIDDCKGLDMKLCQLAEEKQLTDEQFRYFTKGWQALWGMINELPSADRQKDDEFKNFDRGDLIALIEAQEERIGELLADSSQEWIPCSERLPEKNGESYLTYQGSAKYGFCQVLYYDDGWNCYHGEKENEINGVVAWMPLPKPWKGANDEYDK